MCLAVCCPWCGKLISKTASGYVASHVTPGNQKCIGAGVAWRTAVNQRNLMDGSRK